MSNLSEKGQTWRQTWELQDFLNFPRNVRTSSSRSHQPGKKHQPGAETLIFFVKFEEGIEIKIMMIIVKKKSDHKRFLLEGIEDGEGEGCGHWCRLLVPPKGDFSL